MGDVGRVLTAREAVAVANEDAPGAAPRKAASRIPVNYLIEARQRDALREEAFKRAVDRGTGKPDASEVLREIIDAWMDKRK